jgi:hypothetical protein
LELKIRGASHGRRNSDAKEQDGELSKCLHRFKAIRLPTYRRKTSKRCIEDKGF